MNGKKKIDGQKGMCGSNSEEKSMSSYTVCDVKDFDLRHIFECGQCFRNRKLAENEYLVATTDRIVTMRTGKIRTGKIRAGKTRTGENSGSENALITGAPVSHKGWGWETVTQQAISLLFRRPF